MSPLSPAFGLQPPRKQMKMGMFPGSSMVEHSAVNRRVASSNLARGAKYLPHLLLTTRPLQTEFLLRKVGQVGQFEAAGSAA